MIGVFDSGVGGLSVVKKYSSENHKFFFSDQPYNLNKISKLCLDQEIKAKIINPF